MANLGDILNDVLRCNMRRPQKEVFFADFIYEAPTMQIEVLEKPKARPIPEKVPVQFRPLAKAVSDYFRNPTQYIDMSTLQHNYNEIYNVCVQNLETVAGLKRLGSGHYSKVYGIDDNHVLKIVNDSDEGYASFVKNVRGIDNPHFPKIYYSGVWGGKQVYILERLTPKPKTEYGYETIGRIRSMFCEEQEENPFVTVAHSIREASKILLKNRLVTDLHGDNMMWRGDCPVVTDPAG